MAGTPNFTGLNTDVDSFQEDDKPPVKMAPGLPRSFGGVPSTSFFSPNLAPQQPSSDLLSDLDARGDKAQAKIRTAAVNQARDDTYIGNQLRDDTERHQKDLEESWNYERAAAGDPALRPWNADDEKAKRVRGPMEQFGSVGFIFAMAASAFTRSPMTSALNAGAAAMTAIQEGDEKSYKSAYQAWKDNSDLALRRFDMEHRLYEDANQLLTTDMNLWKTKTSMIAAQFNDQTTLAMLDAGMYPQVVETKEKLANSAIKVREAQQGFQEFDIKTNLFTSQIDAWKNDPEHPERKEVNDKKPTPEYVQMKLQAWHNVMDPAYRTSRQTGVITEGRVRAQGVEAEIEEMKAKGELKTKKEEDDYRAKRTGELKTEGAGITGNEQVKLKEKINRLTHFEEISDVVIKTINAHPMATGLPGKAMRLEERLANLVSAGYIKDSDRVQMMRDVELLQGWADELLFSRNSKLKMNGERIKDIVGGLNAGDTRDNTLASLKRMNGIMKELKTETQQILGGSNAPAAPAPAPSSGKPPWATDPIVK